MGIMENERKRIGKRIAYLREEKGLSQEELAYKVGAKVKTIVNIESGKFNPGFDSLQKISNVFGKNVDIV